MKIVKEIYDFTRANNLAENECDFSRNWLNKSARYYNMLKLTGRDASFDALVRLSTNLQLRKASYQQSAIGEMRAISEQIEEYGIKLNNVMKARSIAEAFYL